MKTSFHTIDEYLFIQPEEHRLNLELIRQTIKSTVPDATEVLSYQMPAFKYHGMLCYYGVFKDHYSLFVDPKIKDNFIDKLVAFKQTKAAVHFKLKEPIPTSLIAEIISYAAFINEEKAKEKKSRNKTR